MKTIYFIIGASGAGKTTAVKKLQETERRKFKFYYFDSIGVPSPEDMIKNFGSGENWQKVTTDYWVKRIKEESTDKIAAILDGQIKPLYIEDACIRNGVSSYKVILFDCSDDVRKQRLIERGHPELANDEMINWAKYLRSESVARGYKILDNTDLTQEDSRKLLLNMLHETEGKF